ncbi:MAG: DUF2207 domain-containing protein [Erysipelotrichaceae bacterium]|nr:DUF2207 domain-containing protein [Erysipelotrichaceae bacterium]
MKKLLKLTLMTVLCLSFVFAFSGSKVKADETMKATEVFVEIEVGENNILSIRETIDIEFLTPHHGILRNIPTENQIRREDGSTDYRHAEIYDVHVNHPYTHYTDGDDYVLRIGDKDVEVTGPVRYVIEYKYDLFNDTLRGADELYLNIIGTQWDYNIEKLTVAIHMPKEFDTSKLGVTHGYYGSGDYSGVQQRFEDKTIYLKYEQTLMPGEAFTVRLELPEGYFKKQFRIQDLLAGIYGILASAVLFLFNRNNYVKYGKPDIVVRPVEFYPPENLTAPQLNHVIYNYASSKSINSLLISLASVGYLKIEEIGSRDYRFIIEKKDTIGLSDEERIYYYGLRNHGITQDDGTVVVTKSDLENSFYMIIDNVRDYVNSNAEPVYEKGQGKYGALSFLSGIFLAGVMPGIIVGRVSIYRFQWYHWLAVALCVLSGIYQIIQGFRFKRRTQRNNELYGRALGFRDFLEVSDRDRLEMLVEEDPSYFYDILPYAYALDLSDKWIKKFEGMMIRPAEWYSGNDFNRFVSEDLNDYDTYASSSPSVSSSSGSDWSSSSDSGGGSSGGGSGGGGSSGW